MTQPASTEEAYEQIVQALNYLEQNGEDPKPQGGDILLVGESFTIIWNRWRKKFEFKKGC